MTLSNALAVALGLFWLFAGAFFGLRYGYFAAIGIGIAAGFVGLVVGLIVTFTHDEIDYRCLELVKRRPRLGTALGLGLEVVFLTFFLALVAVPPAVFWLTRPQAG